MELKNKTVVITGGGSGMGRELVLNLLKRGNKVIALDINESGLQETSRLAEDLKEALAIQVVDIASKESIDELTGKIIASFGQVDGIINNAGIIQPFERLGDLGFASIKKVFDINFFGTLYLIKAFLPHLLTRPEAHIVNISSMGSFLPIAGQSIYGASKAAVKMMSESLAFELKETNVRVMTVFPGAIFTNIRVNSGLGEADTDDSSKRTAPKGVTLPSVAAQEIIKGMEKNKNRIFVGKDSKILRLLSRLSPDFAYNFIYNRMKDKILKSIKKTND